jgi:hypothetical protein
MVTHYTRQIKIKVTEWEQQESTLALERWLSFFELLAEKIKRTRLTYDKSFPVANIA